MTPEEVMKLLPPLSHGVGEEEIQFIEEYDKEMYKLFKQHKKILCKGFIYLEDDKTMFYVARLFRYNGKNFSLNFLYYINKKKKLFSSTETKTPEPIE